MNKFMLPIILAFLTITSITSASNIGSSNGITSPLSNTIDSGYSTYFWAASSEASGSGAVSASGNWITDVSNSVSLGSGGTHKYNASSIGHNTITTGTWTFTGIGVGAVLSGFATNVLYANMQSGSPYVKTSANGTATSTFTVSTSNSFVILAFASGGGKLFSSSTNASNTSIMVDTIYGTEAESKIMIIGNIAAGNYIFTAQTGTHSALSMAAYVWNNPTTTSTSTTTSTIQYTFNTSQFIISGNVVSIRTTPPIITTPNGLSINTGTGLGISNNALILLPLTAGTGISITSTNIISNLNISLTKLSNTLPISLSSFGLSLLMNAPITTNNMGYLTANIGTGLAVSNNQLVNPNIGGCTYDCSFNSIISNYIATNIITANNYENLIITNTIINNTINNYISLECITATGKIKLTLGCLLQLI
jgi:hypothetical protein